MEVGNSNIEEIVQDEKLELNEIKIQGAHAFIALLKSVIRESAWSMSTDGFTLMILGMKSDLEKLGYNLEEDWKPFIEGVVSPILQEMKETQNKNKNFN